MNQTEYISSARVIFSDRGSIYLGILVLFFMIALSFSLLVVKLKKKNPYLTSGALEARKQAATSILLRHRFLFKPSRANYLLFFSKSSVAAENQDSPINPTPEPSK
ncbi:MAG: hypothetical protein S4CHLAM7_13850 [Chlamydiae bacterium]|nr:hypothetical protein [Chlamydiota bacterium]